MKKIIVGLFLFGLIAPLVRADVPKTMNYQGRLTDLSGNPLPDNISRNLTIKIYLGADPVAYPTPIWTANISTATKNGYFNIALAGGTPDLATLDFNQPYYIGIQVAGDNEMTPRQPLASTPYSLNVPDNAVTSAKIAAGAVSEGKLALTDVTTGNVSASAHGFVPKAPNDTTQFLCGNGAWQGMPGYQLVSVTAKMTSGTYTPSTGVRAILVECQGPGGGGGGAVQTGTDSGLGSGGGAGGYTRGWITPVAGSYSYAVGQGGSGGSGNGNPGSANTTFDTMIAGPGAAGLGGVSGSIATVLGGGNGGSASGGNLLNISGGAGGMAIQLTAGLHVSGKGGNSISGIGGKEVYNQPGGNGTGYGSGGAGASAAPGSSNRSGGNGANGLIIIWEYK